MTKKSLILIIACMIILIFLSIYYYNHINSGIIETIYPDSSEWRVKAKNKGGLIITNASNSIYDTINHTNQTTLKKVAIRPAPEKPIQIFEFKNSDNDPFQNLMNDKIIDSNDLLDITDDNNDILNKSIYKLQLASYKSEKDAINELNQIKQRSLKILDQSSIKIIQNKYQNKIFFTIISGDYPISKAKILCKKLHLAQQECVLY